MRVIHSSFEFPPQSTGGLGTYLNDLIELQLDCNDNVALAYHGDGHVAPPCQALFLPSFGPLGQLLTHPADSYGAVDLLISHDWQGLAATSELWGRGVPLIYTCHLPLQWDVGEFSDIPCPYDRELEFTGILCADAVICVSTAVEAHLHKQYPFCRGKTIVCPNGTDTDFFTPNQSSCQDERVLFVGRYCEQKGFDLLPEIMRRVWDERPDTRLEIMGTGPLEDTVRYAFTNDPRVEWAPFGDSLDVRAAYWRATAVVMPSRLEPFGLVAVEAMASGTPIVATATGGLADIVSHNENGLLAGNSDPGSFASALLTLLNAPEFSRTLGAAARVHTVGAYDIRLRMQAVRETYTSVYQSMTPTGHANVAS